MTMSLILCTIYARSQDYIIHDNSLLIPDVPTPFLQTNPYPLGTTTPCKLEVGKTFNSMAYRAVFYGGNIGVSQSTSTFGNYLGKWSFTGAWQKKTLSGLPIQYTFIPGINYLVNYHRWGDYAAHFGLRATNTTRNDSYPEGISYTEAPQKDAVITWAYETGAIPNRLIFQSIEGVDTSVPKPQDLEHEWATILSNGNIGSGTSNPTAQFQIKPLNTPGTPLFEILNGSSNPIFSFFEGSFGGTFNSVGQHSITSPLGVTPGTYKPFSINNQNGVELFSVRDDANTIINGQLGINRIPTSGIELDVNGDIFVDGAILIRGIAPSYPFTIMNNINNNLFRVNNNGDIYIDILAGIAGSGNTKPLYFDNSGKLVPGGTSYSPWEVNGNNTGSPTTLIFGTNNTASISLVAGGLNIGEIEGLNTGERGFLRYYKPVSFGSAATPTTNHTLTTYSISSGAGQGPLKCFDNGGTPLFEVENSNITFLNGVLNIAESSGDAILDNYGSGDIKFDNNYTYFKNIMPVSGGSGGTSSIGSPSSYWQNIYGQVGNISLSDTRLKENIIPLKFGLNDVLKIKSYSYNYKSGNGIHHGFIAQDLKKIFENTIVQGEETDSTYIGVIYEELIPVLTNAIQEQQRMIDSLRLKLEIVYNSNSINTSLKPISQKVNINKQPILFQNSPNPFNGITFIDYFIPENTDNAFIKLVDNNGRLIKVFSLNNLGYGQIELSCDELANGTYYYSLLVDGKLVDTKKMLILEKGNH